MVLEGNNCQDDGSMQFWMFILMAMENNIASNKLGFEVLYTVFKQSLYFGLDPNRSVDEVKRVLIPGN